MDEKNFRVPDRSPSRSSLDRPIVILVSDLLQNRAQEIDKSSEFLWYQTFGQRLDQRGIELALILVSKTQSKKLKITFVLSQLFIENEYDFKIYTTLVSNADIITVGFFSLFLCSLEMEDTGFEKAISKTDFILDSRTVPKVRQRFKNFPV